MDVYDIVKGKAYLQFNGESDPSLRVVLLIGDEQVGKSAILRRFSDDRFSEEYVSTIGVDFAIRQLETTGKIKKYKKMQVWDTAGQERFRTIVSSYYRGAQFAFIVYDTTNRATFESVKSLWLNEVQKFAAETVRVVLVGNKTDLSHLRAVSSEEVAEYAAANDIQFMEVSAKNNLEDGGVDQLFQWAADASQNPAKKLAPSVSEESTIWLKKILPFFDQFKYYQPIVKLAAPKLEAPHIKEWIDKNTHLLTQDILTKMYHCVHLSTYERKGTTVQQAVYLGILGTVIGCNKLTEAATYDLMKLNATESDIMSVPKLIEDSAVSNIGPILAFIQMSLNTMKEAEASRKKFFGVDFPRYEVQWRELISRLYDERESTGDVTVIVEDKPYKAHKLALVYNCDFFASCLMSNFKEADKAEVKLDAEVTTAAWESLLTYFYKFDTSHITDANVCLEIITCSSYLMLTSEAKSPVTHTGLLKHCNDVAYDSITDDSALELLQSAYQNADAVAKEVVIKYIINNYFRLLETYEGEFVKLPKPLMFSVLNRLVQQHTANSK